MSPPQSIIAGKIAAPSLTERKAVFCEEASFRVKEPSYILNPEKKKKKKKKPKPIETDEEKGVGLELSVNRKRSVNRSGRLSVNRQTEPMKKFLRFGALRIPEFGIRNSSGYTQPGTELVAFYGEL